MSIQIYILSKLAKESSYPYKLKKELSEPIPFDKLANLSESKLYYHFESLTKQGLIEPTEIIKEENRPDKQVFAITEQGLALLPNKIYQLFEKADSLSDTIVGLMNLDFVDRAKIIKVLEEKLRKLEKKRDHIKNLNMQVKLEGTKKEGGDFLTGYFISRFENEGEWISSLIEKIRNRSI